MFKKIIEGVKKYARIITLIFAIMLVVSLGRNISRLRASGGQIENKRQAVVALEEEQRKLEKELERVESEQFVEMQLRDKLGYAKEGEIVIVLPDEDTLREIGKFSKEDEVLLPDPNWVRWAKLFELM